MNEKIARVIAGLTADGHLQLDKRRGVISFYSKNHDEIDSFNTLFFELFGKKGNVFSDNRSGNLRYKLFIASRCIALKLSKMGVPTGNKTNCVFLIPHCVRTGNSTTKAAYLQMLFDCEGSIFLQIDGRWRITYGMHKRASLISNGLRFFEEIKSLLNEFQVDTSKTHLSEGNLRKDGTKSVALKFDIKKSSFPNFSHFVSFGNPTKREKLHIALNR